MKELTHNCSKCRHSIACITCKVDINGVRSGWDPELEFENDIIKRKFKSGAVRDSVEGKGKGGKIMPDCFDCKERPNEKDCKKCSCYVYNNCNCSFKSTNSPIPATKEEIIFRKFKSGAVRDKAEGKGRCDLLHAVAILRLAKIYEEGYKKYGYRNWEKGIPISSFIDSGMRHLLKYMDGQTDEDHLARAAWNLMGAMWTEEKKGEK